MTANRLCEPESKLGVWIGGSPRYICLRVPGLTLGYMYEGWTFFTGTSRGRECRFLPTPISLTRGGSHFL